MTAVAILLGPLPAAASGFGLVENTPDWLGNGFAGEPAKGYDASTVWENPAGMALLDDNEFEGAASYIAPSAKFSGTATNPLTGGAVSGGTGGNGISATAAGAAFAVIQLGPNWRAGFSIMVPYGDRTSYPDNWVGRYQSLVSTVTDINYGLAVSYKVNDQLLIGGGPNFDYFSARLTQAVNVPTLSALTGQDPIADVHGNDLGFGYNAGVMYRFDPATRIGVDYRSRIRHDIFGIQKITIPAIYYAFSPQLANLLNQANSSATTAITLPDSVSAGVYHQVTPRLAVMGSVVWTDWSLLNAIHFTVTNGSGNTTIVENYRNSWLAAIGTNYQIFDNLLLQIGLAYDQSPVTDATRDTRVPDANHYDLGGGIQYQILPSTNLQFAYGHVFSPGGTVHNTASASPVTPSGEITGRYADTDNSASLGLVVKF